MARSRRIVVVGASLAGVRTAEALRDRGFDGELLLVGAEEHLPYDRPPLSKAVLADQVSLEEIQLWSREEVVALNLELRLGRRARSLDPATRRVTLDDGETLRYDDLVIATGSAAWLPGDWDMLEGVYLLRTLDDCLAIRTALQGSPRVAVVGGGFIGCEVASTARQLGCEVVIVEPLAAPMARVLGPEIAVACADIPLDQGVRLVCDTAVEGFDGTGRVERLRLGSGGTIDADVVVIGVGARPVTDWLLGSGLTVADGVICDGRCATSADGVYAAGDVARWFNSLFEQSMRIEHWTNAAEQGAFVAGAILDGQDSGAYSPVPFVWSEQYGHKIEIAGVPKPDDRVRIIEGAVTERRFVAVYEREGRISGALALDSARGMLKIRRLLGEGRSHESSIDCARSA